MTHFLGHLSLGGTQSGPDIVDSVGRHVPQVLYCTSASAEETLKNDGLWSILCCEPPEDDPSPFGAEELVLPVVGDRARQDVVRLSAGELIKSPEAEVEPHLLLEAIELLLGACWIKAASTFKDGDPKLRMQWDPTQRVLWVRAFQIRK